MENIIVRFSVCAPPTIYLSVKLFYYRNTVTPEHDLLVNRILFNLVVSAVYKFFFLGEAVFELYIPRTILNMASKIFLC